MVETLSLLVTVFALFLRLYVKYAHSTKHGVKEQNSENADKTNNPVSSFLAGHEWNFR